MTPDEFIQKWAKVLEPTAPEGAQERALYQQHFLDLCSLAGQRSPLVADPKGESFRFEKPVAKMSEGKGYADVWKRGHFGIEYKGPHGNLSRAYVQLKNYADSLENPPLLVVSDMRRIVIHTNFTSTVHKTYEIEYTEVDKPENLATLRALFHEPEKLRPGVTRADVTREAAAKFAELTSQLAERKHDAQDVAHFLNRLIFCMFAEDCGLLPDRCFYKAIEACVDDPHSFTEVISSLFRAMSKGGRVGYTKIDWFNGGLFDSDIVIPLTRDEIISLLHAARLDWSEIEPAIFGTLFERGLDPSKRSQLGAHYTDPETILRIIRPVISEPLEQEWEVDRAAIQELLDRASTASNKGGAATKFQTAAENIYKLYLERLDTFRVLDPACGSGNFLYLALKTLKDFEKKVRADAALLGFHPEALFHTGPHNLLGIEINPYASELARVSIWIGELQWMIANGYGYGKNPILKTLHNIENRDALLNADHSVASWPKTTVIIGNPPFVGGVKKRRELGNDYFTYLSNAYSSSVPNKCDLVCYWFEKARQALLNDDAVRVGLVATNTIRQQGNRRVIERIVSSASIYEAWTHQPWVNEGASLQVALVCFALPGGHSAIRLNDESVAEIHADLRGSTVLGGNDLSTASRLLQNSGQSFFGLSLAGKFTINEKLANEWLTLPNPNGKPNSDVLKPLYIGSDITGRWNGRWVIDFGTSMTESQASMYEKPFEHVKLHVKDVRSANRRPARANMWWKHGEARPGMRAMLNGHSRFIVTSEKSKHRFFEWLPASVAPEHRLIVFPRSDDTFFGILSSSIHVTWALEVGSALEDRPAYATRTCFETFPFPDEMTPDIPASTYADNPKAQRIASAAAKLVEARENYLNPPMWIDRVPAKVPGYPDRIVAKPEFAAQLKERTLTNLYNTNPHWLELLQRDLDNAVFEAYGWPLGLSKNDIVDRLFALNQVRKLQETV
ncbi:class I SAM-dependent DNA methyltransferase [Pseudomonas tolaasii]|uniref:class I SAM-dependent DNA methyltransferase n=1 Tax=Pseudomonas tolaasii TaxID=29442 RepID=UPI00031DDA32|nr:DNA methyltransferase [Pseudomonas tolaasii]